MENNINLSGVTRFSSIDFPGKLSAVLHFQGCPLKCVYCHSDHLQNRLSEGHLKWSEFINFIEKRRKLLDAIVLSGGEPCSHHEINYVINKIKENGFEIGLHTSGVYPKKLEEIIDDIDWIGFDLKSTQLSKRNVTGIDIKFRHIEKSIDILINSKKKYEIRTTWHPKILTDIDMISLAEFLATKNIKKWVIQPFWPGGSAPKILSRTIHHIGHHLLKNLTEIIPDVIVIKQS
jgi:anaerobic ribonucleoside-triphosphate reductase activating protein